MSVFQSPLVSFLSLSVTLLLIPTFVLVTFEVFLLGNVTKCWSVTYTHQSICTLKGSKGNISCSYTYPSYHEIKQAFWFTKWSGMEAEDLSSVPGYEGHIEYLGDKESDCTLRITDLRLSDSAGYMFRFITSGDKFAGSPVSLTVTDVVLEMDPTSVSERENVTLRCRTKCTLDPITVYSWYKNGQPIPNSNTSSPVYILFSVSSEDTGRYSCSVEGHEDLPSAEETLNVRCKYMGFKPLVWYINIVSMFYLSPVVFFINPSGEIVEGSSVNLTCSSDANPPVDKYTWYKVTYKNMSMRHSGQRYTIHNISSEDREGYYCEALNIIGRETIPVHINVICKYDTFCLFFVLCNLTYFILTSCIYKLMTLQQCFPGFLWWGWGLS
uniref:B-cell receptor CD22 n=1 Tax=Oncorhynchus kisutch TaxID=8019 RepID=A0A8C7MQ02_ONCKI